MTKMGIVGRLWDYINPLRHLGERQYSIVMPLSAVFIITVLLELYVNVVIRDPSAVGLPAIIVYIALIIFFAFRSGIKGGMTIVAFTVAYYLYIIDSRMYTGTELKSGLNTTAVLAILYSFLAIIIGWLKQKIDVLIESEVNARKMLLTIIRRLPVGVVITDTDGKIIKTNDQLKTIEQVDLRSESPIAKAIKSQKVVKNREFEIHNANGSQRNVLISASPILDTQSRCVGAVAIIQDISFMRETEKRKDDFINIASHELKTPITSLILYLDLLRKRLLKKDVESASQTVQRIGDQVGNLQRLVKTLLDVSSIQTGKIRMRKEEARLDVLIEQVVGEFQENSRQQKIMIKSKRPLIALIDKNRIYQVLANLLTNAIKYSSGRGEIAITLDKTKDDMALVSVRDHGIGIKKELHKKIFEKLYQVNDDKAATFPGFGMGLYIAREIVSRHGGKIWVESEPGKGATFYFSLPV